jgi:hypothetical protein
LKESPKGSCETKSVIAWKNVSTVHRSWNWIRRVTFKLIMLLYIQYKCASAVKPNKEGTLRKLILLCLQYKMRFCHASTETLKFTRTNLTPSVSPLLNTGRKLQIHTNTNTTPVHIAL